MDTKKIIVSVVTSVLVTSVFLGTFFYFWQNEQNKKMLLLMEQKNLQLSEKLGQPVLDKQVFQEETVTKKEENVLVTESVADAKFSLSETHVNRLFTIDYPSEWIKQVNESGALTAILPPDDDHSVVTVRYVTSYDNIANCDLMTARNWEGMTSTLLEKTSDSRLLRYEATNRFGNKQVAYVAYSGGGEIFTVHDCTIIDFEDVWTPHKSTVSQIINSVKLRK